MRFFKKLVGASLLVCSTLAFTQPADLVQAAKQGDAKAQYSLGFMLYDGQGAPKNYAEATKWFRMAAEQGHAGAQFNLGVSFHNGEGVPKNYREAYFWQSLAASQNDEYSQTRDATEKLLTPNVVSAVQARTAVWRPKPSTERTYLAVAQTQ